MSSHLPAQFTAPLSEVDPEIAEALATDFEGGRHARRVDKIAAIEAGTAEQETPQRG
jgi:ribose 5-phosphate isomerase RpiB